MPLVLHGYRYSVYLRIVRLALAEKGVAYERVEVNPFAPDVPSAYLALHPFGRVPTLVHDDFVLYETGAITRYLDRGFAGPALQPRSPRALARMDQIIGVVDSYGYWPLVRQVFSHGVFRPAIGQPADEAEVERGLAGAAKVLAALEALVGARRLPRRPRAVSGRSSSRRDDRLLRRRAGGCSAAAEPSAARPVVDAFQPAPECVGDRSRPAERLAGHRGVSAFALRPRG